MQPIVKAVIFDLDGTLIDSVADIGAACNAALADHGLPTHELQRYRDLVGEGVHSLVERAMAPAPYDPAVVDAVRRHYATQMWQHTAPYPGVRAVLDALVARGIAIAVLSNKPDAPTRALVGHFFADLPWVEVAGHREDRPRKPDPTVALALCAKAGATPATCAFVGDTAVDVATARAAGMRAVGVTWGFRPAEVADADACAGDAPALLAALG